MLEDYNIENILFLDIETVRERQVFSELSDRFKDLWAKKAQYFLKQDETPESVYEKAGIYAEFGKIICISIGFLFIKEKKRFIRIKSFYGNDEKSILTDFINLLNNINKKNEVILCAHNGKEFDYPYISRRILINGLKLPKALDIAGKKPWEIKHLDTMDLWKFGDYKHYTSLNLLTEIFNIPTPKDDIDGSMVAKVYWQNGDIERIKNYCQKDVIAIIQLFLKLKSEELIDDGNVEIIS